MERSLAVHLSTHPVSYSFIQGTGSNQVLLIRCLEDKYNVVSRLEALNISTIKIDDDVHPGACFIEVGMARGTKEEVPDLALGGGRERVGAGRPDRWAEEVTSSTAVSNVELTKQGSYSR